MDTDKAQWWDPSDRRTRDVCVEVLLAAVAVVQMDTPGKRQHLIAECRRADVDPSVIMDMARVMLGYVAGAVTHNGQRSFEHR